LSSDRDRHSVDPTAPPPPATADGAGDHTGSLDGVHLIRFGQYHIAGGASAHVRILNRELARHHRVTIHQFYRLTGREEVTEPRSETFRRGTIHTIPVAGGRMARAHRVPDDLSSRRRMMLTVRRFVRKSLRRLAIIATLGDNSATDMIRRVFHDIGTIRYLPEVLDVTARIPLSAPRARRLIALRENFVHELEPLLTRIGDAPVLFVNHVPWEKEGAAVTGEVHRRGIPIGVQHHAGWSKDNEILFWWARRKADLIGGVYTRGLEKLLGPDAVDLGSGIDTAFFDQRRAGSGHGFRALNPRIRRDSLLVLAVGTISERKRQLDIIRAARLLRDEPSIPDFQVAIIGEDKEPEYKKILVEFVEGNDLSRDVVFFDHMPVEDLRIAYRDADLGVLASRFEGRPRVLLEMGAMGLPVVATDADATRETFLPGRSGYLVDVYRPDQLARAMGDLLRDPALRLEFGRAGSEFVRTHYSLANLMERHVTFYLDILGARTVQADDPT
jgi:glycosyltransferase involved in cell wall biosynthesis